MSLWEHKLARRLKKQAELQRYRQRRNVESLEGTMCQVGGKRLINFCSNDYLGLKQNEDLRKAAKRAIDKWGTGSGASHLVCGHLAIHDALESELASWQKRDRAIVYSTGYMANLGVITALLGRHDIVFQDRLNHASLIDAAALCDGKLKRFLHSNLADLRRQLELHFPSENKTERSGLVAVDGIYSMDGDCAPLSELSRLCSEYQLPLMVDEAHAVGAYGENGAGLCESLALGQEDVPILMGTFGKALGGFGAFVAGSSDLIESLVQFSRQYIYTTALPPSVAASNLAALHWVQKHPEAPARLAALIRYFRNTAQSAALPLLPSGSAIQPLVLGDEIRTLRASALLESKGFWVGAIRPPTVAQGASRLRITLNLNHTETQIDALIEALEDACH